jgi:hypothetical protein
MRLQSFSSIARGQPCLAGAMPCGEGLDDLIEESRRQEAIVIPITAADFPKIIAWPIEFVALCNDDPGTLAIKSEMTLDRSGNFDGRSGIGGRSMRDRQNHDDRCIVRRAFDREHNHARAILAPFFPSRFVLVVPQIGIGYDEARFGRGDRHMRLRYFRSSTESRCACRSSMREDPIA